MPDISMAETERVIRASLGKAQELGIKVSVSVVDSAGNLVGMMRMDGARGLSADMSRGKATASAWMGDTSGNLQQRASSPIFQVLIQREGGRFVPSQGAVPIRKGGQVIGAVGVGGGTSQQDEDVAAVGAATVK